jgi:hypothetical protein
MSYNLFIDDVLDPHEVIWGSTLDKRLYKEQEWIVARNWPEVCEIILSLGLPRMISFDHDMGEYSSSTGLEIAQLLVKLSLDAPNEYAFSDEFQYRIHTQDPRGGEMIKYLLEGVLHDKRQLSRSVSELAFH